MWLCVILTLKLFPFVLHKLSHFNAYSVVRPLSLDHMPSSDEKSDPFLFQSLFSLLISVFVTLTDSVSLYAFCYIFHTLHGNWYKFNPCCFWIFHQEFHLLVFLVTEVSRIEIFASKKLSIILITWIELWLFLYMHRFLHMAILDSNRLRLIVCNKNYRATWLCAKNACLTADSVRVHSFTVCWCLPSVTLGLIALLTLWPTDPGGP